MSEGHRLHDGQAVDMIRSDGKEREHRGLREEQISEPTTLGQELTEMLQRELLESQRGPLALHSELDRKNEELRENARALQETLEMAERLSAATERLGWEEELENFFPRVSTEATGRFQPDRFAIFLMEKEPSLRCVYSRGFSRGPMEKFHRLGALVAQEAFRRRGFLCVLEASEGPPASSMSRHLSKEGFRTLAVIPLMVGKEPKGASVSTTTGPALLLPTKLGWQNPMATMPPISCNNEPG